MYCKKKNEEEIWISLDVNVEGGAVGQEKWEAHSPKIDFPYRLW